MANELRKAIDAWTLADRDGAFPDTTEITALLESIAAAPVSGLCDIIPKCEALSALTLRMERHPSDCEAERAERESMAELIIVGLRNVIRFAERAGAGLSDPENADFFGFGDHRSLMH